MRKRRNNLLFDAFLWYLALALLHLAVWPLVYRSFDGLPDRGYSVGRLAGLVLVSWLWWLGWIFDFWLAGSLSAWFCLLAVGAVCRLSAMKMRACAGGGGPLRWICGHYREILTIEIVLLVAFLAGCALRGFLPGVFHTEQPSDMMMLNSLWQSRTFPAQDAWLAGYPLSYYHFGYWMQNLLGRLTDLPPRWGYNLGLATLLSLLAGAAYGIGFNLANARTARFRAAAGRARWRRGLPLGLFAAGAVCLAGNLRTFYDLGRYGWWRDDWWWLSSRAIRDSGPTGEVLPGITEFPAFSFVLGDNHPHLHGAPLLLLMVALVLHSLLRRGSVQAGEAAPFGWNERLWAGLVAAALLMVNSWDLATGLLLVAWASVLPAVGNSPGGDGNPLPPARVLRGTGEALLVAGLALLFAAPYFAAADAGIRGVLPNVFFPTALDQAAAASGAAWGGLLLLGLTNWRRAWSPIALRCFLFSLVLLGLFLAGSTLWLHHSARGAEWLGRIGFEVSPGIWGEMIRRRIAAPFVTIGLLVAIHWSFFAFLNDRTGRRPEGRAVLLLAGVGFILLLIPELMFVHDVFGYRVNTVFKLHYAAWLLLGLAGGASLSLWRFRGPLRRLRRGMLVLFGLTLLYPLAASATRVSTRSSTGFSGDVLHAWRDSRPEFLQLLAWTEDGLPPGTIVVQAPGHQYEAGSSLLSSLTGRPTPVGWAGHELQWRSGDRLRALLEERSARVAALYRSKDPEAMREQLGRLGGSVVYVGPREAELYQIPDTDSLFDRHCATLFRKGPERLYKCALEERRVAER